MKADLTLAAFLLARLDEDEQAARGALWDCLPDTYDPQEY